MLIQLCVDILLSSNSEYTNIARTYTNVFNAVHSSMIVHFWHYHQMYSANQAWRKQELAVELFVVRSSYTDWLKFIMSHESYENAGEIFDVCKLIPKSRMVTACVVDDIVKYMYRIIW